MPSPSQVDSVCLVQVRLIVCPSPSQVDSVCLVQVRWIVCA